MSRSLQFFASCTLALGMALPGAALAQDHSHHAQQPQAQEKHAGHPQQTAPPPAGVDHSGHATEPDATQDHDGMDHSAMGHDLSPEAPPKTPIPTVTDADRAAAFPSLQHHMEHTKELNSYLAFNRIEFWDADHGSGQAWEAQGWIGSDLNRLWLRSEGERVDGHTESADLEAFYGRSVSPWWDVVAGIRHDFKPGDSREWLALGVQGLAPYKFEVQATAYFGESGQSALNLEAEYELLLTNRLILQPMVEIDLHGKDEPERGIGSGLSVIEAGLRLRYEVTRRFAPYVGVVHERSFGETADLRDAAGEEIRDTRLVAGVRVWF